MHDAVFATPRGQRIAAHYANNAKNTGNIPQTHTPILMCDLYIQHKCRKELKEMKKSTMCEF
jgi:hypothetical protein